jgi:hypothetical protein
VLVDAGGAVGSPAVAERDLAAFEVAEEFLPLLLGGAAVLLAGTQFPAAGDERPVPVDGLLGVDRLIAHGRVDVAVSQDQLGDVGRHAVHDGISGEDPPEVVRGEVQRLAGHVGEPSGGVEFTVGAGEDGQSIAMGCSAIAAEQVVQGSAGCQIFQNHESLGKVGSDDARGKSQTEVVGEEPERGQLGTQSPGFGARLARMVPHPFDDDSPGSCHAAERHTRDSPGFQALPSIDSDGRGIAMRQEGFDSGAPKARVRGGHRRTSRRSLLPVLS